MSALIRYQNPVSSLLDEFFNSPVFSYADRDLSGTSWPKVDITESENEYKLHADLPGMKKEDIKIEVENGVLAISGHKKNEHRVEKERYSHLERSYGSFSRTFYLPEHVDQNSISAQYRDGVLELTMKKTEEAKPKSIKVRVE